MDHQDLDRKLVQLHYEHDRENLINIIEVIKDVPGLYPVLYWMDRGGAAIIFANPDHTISWVIATRANAGDALAIDACKALNLLSPDHCAWALSNESLCRVTP